MSPTVQLALASGGLFTGVVGLLIFVGRLYYSGKLVPRTVLDDVNKSHKEQLDREREISTYYRVNGEMLTTTLTRQVQLTERLVEEQKLIKDFIFGLKRVVERDSQQAAPEGERAG